jgi:virginiamycin B lyase
VRSQLRLSAACGIMLLVTGCSSVSPTTSPTPMRLESATEVPVPPAPTRTTATASPASPAAATPGEAATPTPIPVVASVEEFPVPAGSHPHDVWPAPDGSVWYTAQATGQLGRLDPASGATEHIALGAGSAPHGVIVGPDGAPWITDGGLNAIVRVDPESREVASFALPAGAANANLNTATFDAEGRLWYTGQAGVYGSVDPANGDVTVYAAPGGRGPYGITTAPDGSVYYASLAGDHVARIEITSGEAVPLEPPAPLAGPRRVWSDSRGRLFITEWEGAQLAWTDPSTGAWGAVPIDGSMPYAVYVDDRDEIWVSDFARDGLWRIRVTAEGAVETVELVPVPSAGPAIRQLAGVPGEVWGAESALDQLVVVRVP